MRSGRLLLAAAAAVFALSACGQGGGAKETTAAQPAETGAAETGAAETTGQAAETGGAPAGWESAEDQSAAAGAEKPGDVIGSTAVTKLPAVDMAKWNYNEADDVYWQTGLSYCEFPAEDEYQTLGFFVPGGFFEAEKNSDGLYTCKIRNGNKVGNYTAETAPVIVPVNTPGYMAMAAPTAYDSSFGYGSVKDYTDQGMILLFAGCRGREQGAPLGVADLKAAIRYYRYNAGAGLLPGAEDSVFTEGMSGGGAQSAILGASGNSALYEPYLKEMGAVSGVSDAVRGSMCWCPVTSLNIADEAYEWNLGATRSGLSEEQQKLSDGMAEAFAAYINGLELEDGFGEKLELLESSDGIFQKGSYYDYLCGVVETSLENFLADTEFPYDASASSGKHVRPSGVPEGMVGGPNAPAKDQTDYSAFDHVKRTGGTQAAVSLTGTYQTPAEYVNALNAQFSWVDYNEATGTVRISSLKDFCRAQKTAGKSLGAFDQLDRGQGENTLFGFGDGEGAHFDPVLAELVKGTKYEAAFKEDLEAKDFTGTDMQTRVNMYDPLYYLLKTGGGYETSRPAEFWRIRTGITQSDTALTTEVNLALAAAQYRPGTEVDFETVWGKGHTMAERTGESTENFISWVNSCMGH